MVRTASGRSPGMSRSGKDGMRFERFIARRFMPRHDGDGGFSGPLTTIAVVGIALGVVVMVMAVSILRGFQQDISQKVVGFGSHITVTGYDTGNAYTETPVVRDTAMERLILATPGVRHLQPFATKGGMVKTEDQIYGIILRGLDATCDTTFYHRCLVDGRLPAFDEAPSLALSEADTGVSDGVTASRQVSNEVLVSTTVAAKLGLKVGGKMRTYFWQGNTSRARAFTVVGLYNTDLTEMDELYVVGSLATVQRLNEWEPMQVGGYELLVDDRQWSADGLAMTARCVEAQLPYELHTQTVTQSHPALFSWLDLLNTNITLILVIMCLVSAVAIVSALLIMIFEKSSTIGLLKALGASDRSVRRIFLMKASGLMLRGILAGDVLALVLSLVQRNWQVVRLDPESYSMSHVPVLVDPWIYVYVSLGTLAVCLLALLLPTARISRISPADTMRIEK